MLIRHLFRALRTEGNAYPHRFTTKYRISSDADTAQEQTVEGVNEEGGEDENATDSTTKKFYNRQPVSQVQEIMQEMEAADDIDDMLSVVGRYLVYRPNNQFDIEIFEKVKQLGSLQHKIQYLKKVEEQKKKQANQPLRRYEKNVKITIPNLMKKFVPYDYRERFQSNRFGGAIQQQLAMLKFAKYKAFKFIDHQELDDLVESDDMKKLKKFYATRAFDQILLTPEGHQEYAEKNLNQPQKFKGFHLNIYYECLKEQIKDQVSGKFIYNSLPLKSQIVVKLVTKMKNNEFPEAHPLKFYWTLLNSNYQENYGATAQLVKFLKKVEINGKSAQSHIAFLCNLFVQSKASNEIFLSLFKCNTSLEELMGAWSLGLIILSRIQYVLSSGQSYDRVNFDDLFNMLRENNENHYQFIKHQLPKVLYEGSRPQIFMVYQKALKHYNQKSPKIPYTRSSKLQQLWGLNNIENGYNIQFVFPSDPLQMKYKVLGLVPDKKYHDLDKYSEKMSKIIQESSLRASPEFLRVLNATQIARMENIKNYQDIRWIHKKLQIDKDITEGLILLSKQEKNAKIINEVKNSKFFTSLESKVIRDILNGNYRAALDYLQLVIAEEIDEKPISLKPIINEIYMKSRKQCYEPGSEEEALFILKQMQRQLIVMEPGNVNLNTNHLEIAFDQQLRQVYDENIQQYYEAIPTIEAQPPLSMEEQQRYCKQHLQKSKFFQGEQQAMNQVKKHLHRKLPEQLEGLYGLDDEDTGKDTGKAVKPNYLQKKTSNVIEGAKKKKKQKTQEGSKNRHHHNDKKDDINEEEYEELRNSRQQKKKNWKDRKQIFQKKKDQNVPFFGKKFKKSFCTVKQTNENEKYEEYLKTVHKVEDEVFAFDFEKVKSFEEVRSEFMGGIMKINENNFNQILIMYSTVPFVGEISVLLQYYFLKTKADNNTIPQGLQINFTTSLGQIQKDYGAYLQHSNFMFKFPEQFYQKLLTSQLRNFNRKQFKKIIAHFSLFQQTISIEIINLICEICNRQRIGVTLLEILELFTNRNIKVSYEGLKILSAGVQKYRNLEIDLLNFLNKYCKKYSMNIESRIFEPYIQNIVKSEQYEKLNNILEMLRHELRPKDYRIDDKLSAQENLKRQKEFRVSEQERFNKQLFEMLEMVALNLNAETQIPPFITQLMDEYMAKNTTKKYNHRELGASLFIYGQSQKFQEVLEFIKKSGQENNIYVFECALKILALYRKNLRKYLKNILKVTLYEQVVPLSEKHLHQLGLIFKDYDQPNIYNEYLEYVLRYQPPISPQTKRLYYLIFNRTTDQYSKNQMSGLLEMLFNETKQQDRIRFKKTKEQQEKKALIMQNLRIVDGGDKTSQIKLEKAVPNAESKSTNNNANTSTSNTANMNTNNNSKKTLNLDNINKLKAADSTLENEETPKKQKSKQKKKVTVTSNIAAEMSQISQTNYSDEFVFSPKLSKKQLRNQSLKNFMQTFMKRYEKSQAEDDNKKVDKDGKKGVKVSSKK